jgi:hypothetical protein
MIGSNHITPHDPGSGMNNLGVKLIAFFLLLAGGLWLGWGNHGFQWTRSIEQSKGPFFRLDVKLKYKGEPLDMSFEVACSARITSYADNSRSVEVGLTPNLYGRRMKDNQAVVVRPPDACSGETTGPWPDDQWETDRIGDIPPGFMPIIIVYENADTLAFGRAYLGDDAYEGPKSELTFLGATVTKSNVENWIAFRETGPKNVVTAERYYSRSGTLYETQKAADAKHPPIASDCYYAKKLLFNEDVKAKIRASSGYQPNAYWAARDEFESQVFTIAGFYKSTKLNLHTEYGDPSPPSPYTDYRSPHAGSGAQSRKAPSALRSNREYWGRELIPSFYPVRSGFMSRNLPVNAKKLEEISKAFDTNPMWMIELDGKANRGFGYCWSEPSQHLEPEFLEFSKEFYGLRGFTTVDGSRVITKEPLENSTVDHQEIIVFGDEYLLLTYSFGLESTGGGV